MQPAANAQPRAIVDYGPDPAESWVRALARDIATRAQGFLVRVYPPEPWAQEFYGYAKSPQDFVGAASGRASTSVTFRDGGAADISSGIVEGPSGDPARRIFAARLRRGQVI